MPLKLADYFGIVASIFLIFIPFPQFYHTYKLKSAHDLSTAYLIFQMIANGTFLVYGILIDDPYVISSNAILIFEVFILLILKYYYQYKKNKININTQSFV